MNTFNPNQIVFEDNHIIIIDKKTGQLVQADKTGDLPLVEEIKDYLSEKYNKTGTAFLGISHRIDRPTSGLVIFAKTSKALARLNQMLQDRSIKKTYLAIVKKAEIPKEDTLIHYLRKNPVNNKSTVFIKETTNAKKSILNYKIIKELDKYMVLEIHLETGRHHQIRAQLSKIGIPVKGDLKYGFDRNNEDGSIHLNAHKLEFIHPVSQEFISLKSRLPKDILWKEVY